MKSFKKKLQYLAVAATIGLGLAGNAQAGVIAQSVLEVTTFEFLNSPGGTPVDISQISPLIFSDNTDANVGLNGATATNSLNQSFFGTLDLPQVCLGNCIFPANDYTHHLAQTVIVARGDTLLDGSPITGTPAPLGANARTVAEVQVNPGVGTASSNLGLLATFTFSVVANQSVTLDFNANGWLIAAITADQKIGSNAQASDSWVISINDITSGTSTLVFRWAPDGAVGGITGGTENSDPCSINDSRSTQIPGITATAACIGHFSATTGLLLVGHTYELNLKHTTTVDATSVVPVPEPSVIALLGFGLFGMGFVGTLRNRKPKV